MLSEAASGAGASIQLQQPDSKLVAAVDPRLDAKAFAKAAADSELAAHFTAVLADWCGSLEELLQEGLSSSKDTDGQGE